MYGKQWCMAAGLLLAAAAAGQVMVNADADALRRLDQLEQRFNQDRKAMPPAAFRQARLRDLNEFNQWMERDYATGWRRPGASPQRGLFIGRSLSYLDGVRGVAGDDPALAVALAGAYRNVGALQESPGLGDPPGAILSYHNSALLLNRLANQNPSDPTVRGHLMFLGGRVRALGGTIPVWMSVPVGGYGQTRSEQRGIPDSVLRPAPASSAPALPSLPEIDESKLDASQRDQWYGVRDRYLSVSSLVHAAESSIGSIKASVEGRGFSLHPDTVRSMTRMKLTLEDAGREIQGLRFASASEQLGIAEAEARKVLKVAGR